MTRSCKQSIPCHKLASSALQAKLDTARSKIIDLEMQAVSSGKAFRASFGVDSLSDASHAASRCSPNTTLIAPH
jgi:hypothetical protein